MNKILRSFFTFLLVGGVFTAGYASAYIAGGVFPAFAFEGESGGDVAAAGELTGTDCEPEDAEVIPAKMMPTEEVQPVETVTEAVGFLQFDWAFPDDRINPVPDLERYERDILSVMWAEVSADGRVVIRQGEEFGVHFHYDGDVQNANPSEWVSSTENGGVNAEIARASATKVLLNVSSADVSSIRALSDTPARRADAINRLIGLVMLERFHGVDIDFEDFGAWTHEDKDYYLLFLTQLKAALDLRGYELAVDLPPIWNSQLGAASESGQGDEWDDVNSQGYYALSYADIERIAPDYAVIMSYDYHYDYSVGRPNQPLAWMGDILRYATSELSSSRILAGIPAAGHGGKTGSYSGRGTTFERASSQPGFREGMTLDEESGEMIWEHKGVTHAISTDESIDRKVHLAESFGVAGYALWHVGENRYGSSR